MKRLWYLLLVPLVLAIVAIIISRVAPREPSQTKSTASGAQAAAARLLLNEVLFNPGSGETPWVEIVNASGETTRTSGLALVNQANDRFELPQGLTMPPGGLLLVRFDGQARIDGSIVHSDRAGFLHASRGSLTLLAGTERLDEAMWSTDGGPSFSLGRGGRIPEFVPGTTLARPRGSRARGQQAWTIFDASAATPAAVNPYPTVHGMMPLSGAVLRSPTPALSWYGVSTARRYRVQVAPDASFTTTVFDRTVDTSGAGISVQQIIVTTLATGQYRWRVQAIFGETEAEAAPFSRPAVFWIESNAATVTPWRRVLDLFSAALVASESQAAGVRKVLPVPFIMQRKETKLLSLEGDQSGPKVWDDSWPMRTQPPWCARAAVAMVAAYFGGALSQDRLSYAGDFNWIEGPRRDISVIDGWGDGAIVKALTFALGTAPFRDFTRQDVIRYRKEGRDLGEYYWMRHVQEIDAGRPVLSTSDSHAWVVVGYGEDARGKYLTINDPNEGQYDWVLLPVEGIFGGDTIGPAGGVFDSAFFFPAGVRARADEPEVTRDSDRDGIMDFDERRFGLNAHAKDTDADGIADKDEIRAWVFDQEWGYWPDHQWGDFSDGDNDDKRMELDADSDNGGCFDGMEDLNRNGVREPELKEPSNFEKKDDPCLRGVYELVVDSTDHGRGPEGLIVSKLRHEAELSLMPQSDGTIRGQAIFSYRTSSDQRVPPTGCLSRVLSPAPTRWLVALEGTTTKLPDGSIEISVKASPTQGPPHPFEWINECPPGASGRDTMPTLNFFGFGPLKLTDGKVEVRTDTPLGPSRTGTQYTLIRLERPRPAPPSPQ
jgi:hypothetical protein